MTLRILLATATLALVAARSPMPKFSDFPASEVFRGRPRYDPCRYGPSQPLSIRVA